MVQSNSIFNGTPVSMVSDITFSSWAVANIYKSIKVCIWQKRLYSSGIGRYLSRLICCLHQEVTNNINSISLVLLLLVSLSIVLITEQFNYFNRTTNIMPRINLNGRIPNGWMIENKDRSIYIKETIKNSLFWRRTKLHDSKR